MNKIKHRDHLSIHDEVARVAQLLSRLITSDHRSNETNDYCTFDLSVNRMCQLRRSHGKDTWDHTPNRTHFRATLIIFGNARSRMCEGFCLAVHDVGSSNFHQTAVTGCLSEFFFFLLHAIYKVNVKIKVTI